MSTALVAVMAAGAANAGDVSLGLGGSIVTGVGVGPENGEAGTDPNKDFHTIFDGEIHFRGVGTLDNGIQIVTHIELRAHSDADQMDEQWLQVKSQFGIIMIGANNDAAGNVSGRGKTEVGIGAGAWAPDYNFTPAAIGDIGGDDSFGVHYYTPNIAGFEVGISWQPTIDNATLPIDTAQTTANSRDRIAVGAAYSNTFGDVEFGIDGQYIHTDGVDTAGSTDETGYAIGASVGFSGLTLEGRWEHTDDAGHVASTDRDRFGGGVTYATGPWTFAAAAAFEDVDASGTTSDTERTRASAGVTYELGAGVNVAGVVMYGDEDLNTGAVGEDEDGFGGALLLGVSF